MVVNVQVSKKSSPNSRVHLYLPKRDYIDYISGAESIDGVVLVDQEYVNLKRKVWVQLICSFRYGREEDEVMGLNFQKELFLASEQIHPRKEKETRQMTILQERVVQKLGDNAFPFSFQFPAVAPSSVMLQQGAKEKGEPCGVSYYIKVYAGEAETDVTHKRSTVTMTIRKVQYVPAKQGPLPCVTVKKDFLMSPSELELEVSLDKQIYQLGDRVAVNISIRNHSNKVVKKIKALIQQGIDVVMFQNGQFRTVLDAVETQDGCPLNPGSTLQKTLVLIPDNECKKRRGIALDWKLKRDAEDVLAPSTLLTSADMKDNFGVVVSYAVRVKLYLGALGGELSADLPVIIMRENPSPHIKFIIRDQEPVAVEDTKTGEIEEIAA